MRLNTFYILVDNALKFWSADLTESYITGCFDEEPTPPTAELLWLDIPPELTPPSSTMFSVQIVCNFDRYELPKSFLSISVDLMVKLGWQQLDFIANMESIKEKSRSKSHEYLILFNLQKMAPRIKNQVQYILFTVLTTV